MLIFFWVDEFACLARFPWHTAKNVTRDPAPVADDFNAQDYATLVAHPSLFWKFLEEFLCLVGLSRHYTLDEETYPSFVDKDGEDMDIFAFIRTTDPTKVKVAKRERREDEPWLLETTVGRTIPLLPIAPDCGESELDASVDKLFDEGGSDTQVEQGHSVGGGDGQDTVIQSVTVTTNTVAEDVIPLQPRNQRKRKTIISDAGGPSHPPKRLREDHGTPSRASISGKSRSTIQQLLLELCRMLRFVISSDSSQHTSAIITEAEVDSFVRPSIPVITVATIVTSTADPTVVVKEKVVKPSLFAADSSSAGGADPNVGIFLDLIGSGFLSVTNGSYLDDGRVCHEMVDEFAPPKFFASVRGIEHDQLFTEFNVGASRQMSLGAEVRMRAEYNIKEKRRLRSAVDEKDELPKVREREIENLKAQLLLKEAEATKAIRFCAEASKFEAVEKSLQVEVEALKEHNTTLVLQEKVTVYEDYMSQLERFQDEKMKVVNDKFDKLYTDFIEITLHLEERFYPHLLTTIADRRWLPTYDMELAVAKCLNSSEYLSALGAAIGKAIEKGMQDGLAVGITHGKEGRVLADVAAYNPSAEDSSVETLMNILRLEETLAKRLGLNKSLPHVDQLMDLVHHSPDQTIVGETALSLSLDVSHIRVQKIRENIANHRSALCDVFIPLDEPFSAVALEGTGGTSKTVPAIADTTTTLSTTLASASTIIPIFVDDYDVVGTDNQAAVNENVANDNATGGDVNPFPKVDDAELNVPE
ncbi:hypothetical protein Tco_0853860 [Tanacetum coccineum]